MSWASAFSSWGWADIVATILVAVGVAGEVWSFLMKIPFNPTVFPLLESKKKTVEKWSLIILLVGVAIEMPATVKNLKDAADATQETVKLERQVEETRLQMFIEGSKAFINALKGKPTMTAEILYPSNDVNGNTFAVILAANLAFAGWNVNAPRPVVLDDQVPTSISIAPGSPLLQIFPQKASLGIAAGNGEILLEMKQIPTNFNWSKTNNAVAGLYNAFVDAKVSNVGLTLSVDPRMSQGVLKIMIGQGFCSGSA